MTNHSEKVSRQTPAGFKSKPEFQNFRLRNAVSEKGDDEQFV
jgi:hypothetical protein